MVQTPSPLRHYSVITSWRWANTKVIYPVWLQDETTFPGMYITEKAFSYILPRIDTTENVYHREWGVCYENAGRILLSMAPLCRPKPWPSPGYASSDRPVILALATQCGVHMYVHCTSWRRKSENVARILVFTYLADTNATLCWCKRFVSNNYHALTGLGEGISYQNL